MAYETGSATDSLDLIDKLQTFCAANGYTVNQYVDGLAWRCLRLGRGGKYYNVYVYIPDALNIYTSVSTGFLASDTISSQPDESNRNTTNPISAPFVEYHFFSDGSALFCTIEWAVGKFRHFGFGEIAKSGSWVGGEFAVGTFWSQAAFRIDSPSTYHSALFTAGYVNQGGNVPGVIRADVSLAPQYRYFDTNSSTTDANRGGGFIGAPYTGGVNFFDSYSSDDPFANSVNNYNGRTLLAPSYCFAHNEASAWYYLGHIASCRGVNMALLSPGQTISLGSDEWLVFPLSQKNGPSGAENSANYGVAFKKVA